MITKTVTPTNEPISATCGKIDIDDNGLLNYIDLFAFAKAYNKSCSDIPPVGGCQGKDVRHDGVYDSVINYIDLDSFAKRYYPNAITCIM